MNSRIREPLIWPPNRNETSKLMSSGLQCHAFGGVHRADRAADALRGLEHGRRVHQGFDVAGVRVLEPSVRVDSTDWLIARLPALAIAITRSPAW
jgi:hypothetical protein